MKIKCPSRGDLIAALAEALEIIHQQTISAVMETTALTHAGAEAVWKGVKENRDLAPLFETLAKARGESPDAK